MSNFKKYLLLVLLVALINAVLVLVFFFPRFNHTDTAQYISTIKYFAGQPEGEFFVYRFLKPLPILIGAFLTNFTAAENTLIIQNILFYFLFVVLAYLLVHKIYQNEKQAFYGAVLSMTAYPMLAYGLASLTDLSGWFFFFISVFIALNFLKKPQLKTAFLGGLVAGFGMLFKENTASAPIFFLGLVFIASQLPLKEKIKSALVFGLAFLLFPLINSFFFYHFYSYTYLDWFRQGGFHPQTTIAAFYPYAVSPLRIAIEIGRTFLLGWLFVILGVLKEYFDKNKERIKLFLAFLLPSLSAFLWSFPHNRILFIAFPFLILLASRGLLRNFKKEKVNLALELGLLGLYVCLNYAALEFFLRYGTILQPPGTLFG